MSDKFKFVLNRNGVRSLLKSVNMINVLESEANEMLARLGPGHEKTYHMGSNRPNFSVATRSKKAAENNLDNNTMIKAVNK